MAKVKIQGNASGTGTLTLTAPNTNSDRTITLPDEDITLGGPFTGGSITSDLSLSDNIKAKFGASDDLQISHDGTHSRIKDTGTGFLVLSGNEIHFNNAANTTNLLVIKDDGRGLSQFTAKAWWQISGTGTVNLKDSHNISSVGDNGTGRYGVNFTNNMSNADYACATSGGSGWSVYTNCKTYSSSVQIEVAATNVGSAYDSDFISGVVFGD